MSNWEVFHLKRTDSDLRFIHLQGARWMGCGFPLLFQGTQLVGATGVLPRRACLNYNHRTIVQVDGHVNITDSAYEGVPILGMPHAIWSFGIGHHWMCVAFNFTASHVIERSDLGNTCSLHVSAALIFIVSSAKEESFGKGRTT